MPLLDRVILTALLALIAVGFPVLLAVVVYGALFIGERHGLLFFDIMLRDERFRWLAGALVALCVGSIAKSEWKNRGRKI